MEWQVFTVIGALVSFVIALIKPVVNLNTSITKLTAAVDGLQKNQSNNISKVSEHTRQIADHELRISILEDHEKC